MAEGKSKSKREPHLCERKFEVRIIKNVDGKGETRNYVHLQQYEAKKEKQAIEAMQNRSTFSRGTAEDVLSALRDFFVNEMREGRRVYIPEIGYFSLSAGLKESYSGETSKITGDDICISGINFRPEASLLRDIGENMHFIWQDHPKCSLPDSTPETVLEKIKEFLKTEDGVTVSSFSVYAGLTKYATRMFLNYFCNKGIMVKTGTDRSPVYLMK
jgi:predicted histone-like DNA-binding protein